VDLSTYCFGNHNMLRHGRVQHHMQEAPARFVAVTVRPEPEVNTMRPWAGAALTVVTGSGYRIEVGDGFTPATLTSLLATLGGA